MRRQHATNQFIFDMVFVGEGGANDTRRQQVKQFDIERISIVLAKDALMI